MNIKGSLLLLFCSIGAIAQTPIVREAKLCERLEKESQALIQTHYRSLDSLGKKLLTTERSYEGFQKRFDQNALAQIGYSLETSEQKLGDLQTYLDFVANEGTTRTIKSLQIKSFQKQVKVGRPAKIVLRVWVLAEVAYQKANNSQRIQNMVFYFNFPTQYADFVENGKYDINSVEWDKAKIYQFGRADENKIKEFATDGNYFTTQDCNCDRTEPFYKLNKDYPYTFHAAYLRLYQGKSLMGELPSTKIGKDKQWKIPYQIANKKISLGTNYKIEFLDANKNPICVSKEFKIKRSSGFRIVLGIGLGTVAGIVAADYFILKKFIFKQDPDLPEPILPTGNGE